MDWPVSLKNGTSNGVGNICCQTMKIFKPLPLKLGFWDWRPASYLYLTHCSITFSFDLWPEFTINMDWPVSLKNGTSNGVGNICCQTMKIFKPLPLKLGFWDWRGSKSHTVTV